MTTPVCNKPNMRLFVEALRSGEFKQTRGVLRRDITDTITDDPNQAPIIGYCCLGVAAAVALRNGCAESFTFTDWEGDEEVMFTASVWDSSPW